MFLGFESEEGLPRGSDIVGKQAGDSGYIEDASNRLETGVDAMK